MAFEELIKYDNLSHFKDKENAMVAPCESSYTASRAYKAGEHFFLKGTYVVATSDIASGGTIILTGTGQNCERDVLSTALDAQSEKIDGLDGRVNVLHQLVDYGYADADVAQEASSSTAWKKLGITRRNTRFILNLSSTSSNVRAKISGEIGRAANNSGIDAWSSGITLINGHRYRATMTYISGTITGDAPYLTFYTAGGHTSLGKGTRVGNVYCREYISTGSSVNLIIGCYANSTLTNAIYDIIIEDITDGVDGLSERSDLDEIGVKALSRMTYPFYITSSKWNNDATSSIIPVSPGDKIEVQGIGSDSSYAVFKSFSLPIIVNATPDFSEADGFTSTKSLSANSFVDFIIPDDGYYLYVLAANSAGANRFPKMLRINGYDIATTAKNNIVTALNPVGSVKLRVMQYNIGGFCWGNKPGGTYVHLPDADVPAKLANYKSMLSEIQPDILCLQEWEKWMDESETVNTNTALFDKVLPVRIGTDAANLQIRSVYTSDYYEMWLPGNDDIPARCYVAKYFIAGREVCVITTALKSDDQDKRVAQLTEIFDRLANTENVVICADMNAGISSGNQPALWEICETYGYSWQNGGYWPATDTYTSRTSGDTNSIDNILVKGNITVRNFKVLTDWYSNLSSDHTPCIVDLYLK